MKCTWKSVTYDVDKSPQSEVLAEEWCTRKGVPYNEQSYADWYLNHSDGIFDNMHGYTSPVPVVRNILACRSVDQDTADEFDTYLFNACKDLSVIIGVELEWGSRRELADSVYFCRVTDDLARSVRIRILRDVYVFYHYAPFLMDAPRWAMSRGPADSENRVSPPINAHFSQHAERYFIFASVSAIPVEFHGALKTIMLQSLAEFGDWDRRFIDACRGYIDALVPGKSLHPRMMIQFPPWN